MLQDLARAQVDACDAVFILCNKSPPDAKHEDLQTVMACLAIGQYIHVRPDFVIHQAGGVQLTAILRLGSYATQSRRLGHMSTCQRVSPPLCSARKWRDSGMGHSPCCSGCWIWSGASCSTCKRSVLLHQGSCVNVCYSLHTT